MKTLTCREHGGTFQVVPSRGRPPVKCGGKHSVCSRYPGKGERKVPNDVGSPAEVEAREKIRSLTGGPFMPAKRVPVPEAPKTNNPSVPMAMAARERLEPLGWLCKGRAFADEDGNWCAEMIATRDEETILMVWLDGELVQQDYSLWAEKPSANGKPKGSLTFDPDECTDRELVRALAGMKITWWNVLGQKEESGVIDATKIRIEHAYNGMGDEMPGDRIVHFTDHAGTGFRAFRVGALLKVG